MPDTAPRHRHLTANMRAALNAARLQPLRRVHDDDEPGTPPWPAAPSTLYALFRHGHLTGSCRVSRRGHRVEEWWATDDGREALEPVEVTRRPGPLLLAEGWPDFTRDPARALRGLGTGVLPDDEPGWMSEAA